jgi:hypothetical protein
VDEKFHVMAQKAVKEHSDLLRSSTMLWGAVTYVLINSEQVQSVLTWTNDWPQRHDREPWMMSNIGIALAWGRGPRAAAPAWREVLAAGASDEWVHAAAGLAFTFAIDGKPEEARRLLNNLEGLNLNSQDKFSVVLANAALTAGQAGRETKSHNRNSARYLLKGAEAAWPGGANTSRGRHYVWELQDFLFKNGLDPAFGKLSSKARRSGSKSSPEKVRWAVIAACVMVTSVLRLGSCGSSDHPGYRRSDFDFPSTRPANDRFGSGRPGKPFETAPGGPELWKDPALPPKKRPPGEPGTSFEDGPGKTDLWKEGPLKNRPTRGPSLIPSEKPSDSSDPKLKF